MNLEPVYNVGTAGERIDRTLLSKFVATERQVYDQLPDTFLGFDYQESLKGLRGTTVFSRRQPKAGK